LTDKNHILCQLRSLLQELELCLECITKMQNILLGSLIKLIVIYTKCSSAVQTYGQFEWQYYKSKGRVGYHSGTIGNIPDKYTKYSWFTDIILILTNKQILTIISQGVHIFLSA